MFRCWLKQTVNSVGILKFFSDSTLRKTASQGCSHELLKNYGGGFSSPRPSLFKFKAKVEA